LIFDYVLWKGLLKEIQPLREKAEKDTITVEKLGPGT